MEQEIAELKVKLLRAEELIQEIQVRGSQGCGGKNGGSVGGVPGTLAPSLLPATFPRDDQGSLPPCMALRSCFRCQGTPHPHWNPWRSQVETQALLPRPLPTTVMTVPPSLRSPSAEGQPAVPYEAPRASALSRKRLLLWCLLALWSLRASTYPLPGTSLFQIASGSSCRWR